MKAKSLYTVALLSLSCVCARGDFNFILGVGDLRDAGGSLMPTSSLLLLVADVNGNGFGGPTTGSFVSGDDLVLVHDGLVGGVPGQTFQTYTISGVAAGIAVRLFWFPTIAATDYGNAGLPLYLTQYGDYRDPVANGGSGTGADGSDPWFTIGSSLQSTLSFVTQSQGGSNPNSAGQAFSLGVCALGVVRGVRQGLVKHS
jgi:hypothetical protein